MRLKKPITAVSAVGLLALAACGGSSNDNSQGTPTIKTNTANSSAGAAGQGKDPTLQPPAAPISGAKKGGTLTVLSVAGLTTMDPTEAYYTNTASILSGLVTRSLTQYKYDPQTKEMI